MIKTDIVVHILIDNLFFYVVFFFFQSRKNDANRLANRGGALLKEEKIRKGINKELPKVTLIGYHNDAAVCDC